MIKLICSSCKHEMFSCTPELWMNSIHKGCGGKYEHEKKFNIKIKENGGIYYNKIFYPVEIFTCNKCDIMGNCPYAWDLYNIDGDCIAEK